MDFCVRGGKTTLRFLGTIIEVGASVVDVNVDGREGALGGWLVLPGLSPETPAKRVRTPGCRCLMIQTYWTVGFGSN